MGLDYLMLAQLLAASVLCIAVFTALKLRYFSSIRDIPGPFFASIGTFWQMYHVSKGDYPIALSKLHEKHGGPLPPLSSLYISDASAGPFVRISNNEVSINHPDAVTSMLAANIEKGHFYNLFAIPNMKYQNTQSERTVRRNVQMRANIAAGYQLTNVIKSEPEVDDLISLMELRLDEASDGGNTPILLGKWLHFLTWDIMGFLTFSKPFGFLHEGRDIEDSIRNTFFLAFYISFMGYCQWLHWLLLENPFMRWLDIEPSQFAWKKCVDGTKERMPEANVTGKPRVDMVEAWMAKRAEHPDRMPEHEIFTAVLGNLGAGGDTAGSVLQGFFYHLLKAPPIHLQRLQAELDRFAASRGFSAGRAVSFADAQQLPYLQACIKETHRLSPGVAWSVPRLVPAAGLTVAGRAFAPGTTLSANPHLIHRLPACFGPDARAYDPARWLRPGASDRYLIAFGVGYNRCLGANVAHFEMSKIAATLLRDFDWRLEDPAATWSVHYLFVTNPSGWKVRAWRRGARRVEREMEMGA